MGIENGIPPSGIKGRLIAPPPRDNKKLAVVTTLGLSPLDKFAPEWTVAGLLKRFNPKLLEKVAFFMRIETGAPSYIRPLYDHGEPGALIIYHGSKKLILVGDLHGNLPRFELLLKKYGPALWNGEIELVFLGDLIHPEKAGALDEMQDSIKMLNALIVLKKLFPTHVHLLIGNHDILFSEKKLGMALVEHWFEQAQNGLGYMLTKMGEMKLNPELDQVMLVAKRETPQAVSMLATLVDELKKQNMSLVEIQTMMWNYQEFLIGCPLSMVIKGSEGAIYLSHTIAHKIAHKDGGVSQTDLTRARHNGLYLQLTMNRHSTDFTAEDLLANSRAMKLTEDPQQTHFVIGHEKDLSGWHYNPFPERKLHIIHGNVEGAFGVVEVENGVPKLVDLPVLSTPAEAAA